MRGILCLGLGYLVYVRYGVLDACGYINPRLLRNVILCGFALFHDLRGTITVPFRGWMRSDVKQKFLV